MKRIHYPINRSAFEKEYWQIFKDDGLQVEWEQLRKKLLVCSDNANKETIYPSQIKDVVCGRYDKLVDIYLDYKEIKAKEKGDKTFKALENDLFSLFSYSQSETVFSRVFQPDIADFFMRHAEELELHLCHYCELSYVNVYGFSSVFKNFGHFLKNATKEEIKHYVRRADGKPLSENIIKDIVDLQGTHHESKITEAFDGLRHWHGMKQKKSESVVSKLRNHFDLDHFLPKSQCPIVGLSLYNFVPSCAVCNEKLKGADEIGGDDKAKWLALSPTSDLYSFEDDVTIKIEPLPRKLKIMKNPKKYRLVFSPKDSQYEPLIHEFLLEERYNYHKNEALRLHDLLIDYPKSRIKMLKGVFGGIKTEKEIENDIFGVEYRQQFHRCMSKLYSDIFRTHYNK
jgi:hypothetical protein